MAIKKQWSSMIFKKRIVLQLKPVKWDSFKGDFLLTDMLFWEHFLYNAMKIASG